MPERSQPKLRHDFCGRKLRGVGPQGLEWVGITHFSWLISSVAKRCSGLQGSQTTGLEPPSDAKAVGAEAELPTDIKELQTMVRQMQAEIAREREAHALSWQALEAKVSTQPSLCVLSDEGLTRYMHAMHCGPASIFLWSLQNNAGRASPAFSNDSDPSLPQDKTKARADVETGAARP